MEGRDQPEGGPHTGEQDRTQSRRLLLPHLMRVREAARRGRKTRFTALLHHVDVDALYRAFCRLKRRAAAGVDGETVTSYEEHLAEKLQDLCNRVHTGRYRPQPVRRVHIPKPDGGQRPLGIPHSHRELHIVPTSRRDVLRSPTRFIHSAVAGFRS